MPFNTGLQGVQDAINRAEARSKAAESGGSTGSSLSYFNWKPGDKKIVRFLTDEVITADFHEFIVDKTGQTKNFLVDPDDPDRLKRYMSPTPGVGWRKNLGNGNLEEPTTREMSVGVAVLRVEKPGPDGKLVIEDYVYDREIEGQTYPSRFFGIVQQSVSNFWHTLAVSCAKRYGTICDRDYEITREGTGFKTKYSILPLPEVPELTDPQVVKQFYFYGQPWDKEDPERFLKCPQTVEQWAAYFSSEDRYRYWLTSEEGASPTVASSGLGEFHPATTHNDEAQAMQASGTSFSLLRDTLLNNAKK